MRICVLLPAGSRSINHRFGGRREFSIFVQAALSCNALVGPILASDDRLGLHVDTIRENTMRGLATALRGTSRRPTICNDSRTNTGGAAGLCSRGASLTSPRMQLIQSRRPSVTCRTFGTSRHASAGRSAYDGEEVLED